MTGTPTVGSTPRNQLDQLQNLMSFLRHPRYGVKGEEAWESDIVAPYMAYGGRGEGRERLVQTLEKIMVRHTKKHLDLKDPAFHVTEGILPAAETFESNPNGLYSKYTDALMKQVEEVKVQRKHDMSKEAFGKWEANQVAETHSDLCDARDGYHKAEHILKVLQDARRTDPTPKALVFAEEWHDLNYTAHWLTVMQGDDAVAQHHGRLRSAALQAFRHDRKHVIQCPKCGHYEEVTGQKNPKCSRVFLKVRYNDMRGDPDEGVSLGQIDHSEKPFDRHGHPNPLFNLPRGQVLVPEDRIEGHMLGRKWQHAEQKSNGVPCKPQTVDLPLTHPQCLGVGNNGQ
jgi:hypothetical protein